MKRRMQFAMSLFWIGIILIATSTFGAVITIDASQSASSQVRVLSESDREIVVEFQWGEIQLDSVQNGSEWSLGTRIANCGSTSRPGWPELPTQSVWLRVPSTAIEFSLDAIETTTERWGIPQAAAENMDRAGRTEFRRIRDASFYQSTEIFPEQAAAITYSGVGGGERLALLTFNPVRYSAGADEWIVHSRIVARLRFDSRPGLDRDQIGEWTKSRYVQRMVINPSGSDQGRPAHGARMLVVTTAEILPALSEWLEWKSNGGVPCQVFDYAEVATSAGELRAFLHRYCDSLDTRPEFLFLVGGADDIPAFFGVDGSITDHPYSLLTGDDYLADISVGRLPAHSAIECANWVERVLAFERDGMYVGTPAATIFSSSAAIDPAHGRSMTTLLSGRGLSVSALQEPQSGSLPQLMNSLSNSPAWIFYIGHGNAQAWSSVEPSFNISAAFDADRCGHAIVVSVACATADLDYPGSSIAESWLSNGVQSSPLAYIGATEPTAFFRSDTIGLGLMRGVFSEQIDRIGPALDYGKLRLMQSFPQPAGGLTEETMQQFCLLGDPSMRVFSTTPRQCVVSIPSAIPVDTRTISVTVTASGRSVANAEICLRDPSHNLHDVAVTNALGQANFSVSFGSTGVVDWTVTGQNIVPEQGAIYVVPRDGYFLQPSTLIMNDSDGDSDGLADRGERGTGSVRIVNLGNSASPGGILRVESTSSSIEFVSSASELPPIAANDTIDITDTFTFEVHDSALDYEVAIIRVSMVVNGDSLPVATVPVVLHAPDPHFTYSTLFEDSGNGDGRPDPGERLQLSVYFANRGSDNLQDMEVRLTSVSEGVAAVNEPCVTANCLSGDSVVCHFMLRAESTLGHGFPLDFECEYLANRVSVQTVRDRQRIGLIPVLLYVMDRNAADVTGIEAALTSLGIEYQRTNSLPEDLDIFESIWIFSGIFPNQSPLSYSASNQLSDYLDTGGRCYWQGGDVWAFDIRTRLHAYFHIVGESDGTANAGPIAGEYGTILQDFHFNYGGENSFIDQLNVELGSQVMLRNARSGHDYPVCIGYAGPNYRTIGCSIELGSLEDGIYPSTRIRVVNEILRWFEIPVRADIYPPEISHIPLREVYGERVPVRVIADIQDASGVATATLSYRVDMSEPRSLPLTAVGGHYLALIPAADNGSVVHYQMSAQDSSLERNVALSPEYSYVVSGDGGVALRVEFGSAEPYETAESITMNGHGGWAVTDFADRSCLEMYAEQGASARYRTPAFRVKNLRNPAVNFWCSVNNQGSSSAVLAVRSSIDGGRTFEQVLWSSPELTDNANREGLIEVSDLLWMVDQDSVVLEFSFSGHGYCRIADVQVAGETTPVTRPVRRLVIHPESGQVVLNWARSEGAQYYVVRASQVAGLPAVQSPIAMTKDTTFLDVESSQYAARFYSVEAVVRTSVNAAASVVGKTGLHAVTARAEDMRWAEKFSRIQR